MPLNKENETILFLTFPSSLLLLLESFSHKRSVMVYHLTLSDSKSPQVSRILLSILVDQNNAAVIMVWILPPIFNSSNFLCKRLETVLSALITIGIKASHRVYTFLSSLARSKYMSLFSFSLIFIWWSVETTEYTKL